MMLLLALRVTVIVHAVSMFLQPVLAGMFMSGRDDMIDSHATNAALLTSITLFLTVLAAVARRRRLVGPRAVPILLGLFVLEIAQLTAGTQHLMRFHVARKASDDSAVPARLSDLPKLTPSGAHRRLVFSRNGSRWRINGRPFDPDTPLLRPRFGDTERWSILSVERHPFHLRGAFFQVLGRGAAGPGRYDVGWKDTVELSPGTEVHLAVRFDTYRGRYLAHCHNLEHEDMAMMATLQIA
ncbi:multicopper oxidase domain-containing protein [Streptomyces sp. NPDC006655]|uniref:multicopper oxidase domain-containing protein n=1 Tax=Streptomyces sp. NPDC006655 TaxID=3156898 RepID=UPI00345348E9